MSLLVLLANVFLSGIAYLVASSLIPRLFPALLSAGLKGIDRLKGSFSGGGGFPSASTDQLGATPTPDPSAPFLPESTGLVAGSVYVLVLCLLVPLPYYNHFFPAASPPGSSVFESERLSCPEDPLVPSHRRSFPHASLCANLASILCLLSAVFLGFLDDLFDIRWRFKLPIPVIASVPLLTSYSASLGNTDVVVPHLLGLRALLGLEHTNGLMSIGPLYYIYMSLLSTFCTNSINILAGVNGVEVGQSIVICLSIILNDLLYIRLDLSDLGIDLELTCGLARGSRQLEDRHLFSLCFMLPLLAVMMALLKFNWYPARSFVGDTFCYFAGMAFAVVGILGHFSKTLLLFFIPQIFNFLYSCPQLFGLIPIPRHRLPARNPKTDKLKPSMVNFVQPLDNGGRQVCFLRLMKKFKLLELELNREGNIVGCSNLTLLNLILIWVGQMREDRLTITVMMIQAVCSLVGFGVRYGLSGLFYDTSIRR